MCTVKYSQYSLKIIRKEINFDKKNSNHFAKKKTIKLEVSYIRNYCSEILQVFSPPLTLIKISIHFKTQSIR